MPSIFQTNRHTNQITRYVPSIPRIPHYLRVRALSLVRSFSRFYFSLRRCVYVVYASMRTQRSTLLHILDARLKRCLEFASPMKRSNGNARHFLPTSNFFYYFSAAQTHDDTHAQFQRQQCAREKYILHLQEDDEADERLNANSGDALCGQYSICWCRSCMLLQS